MTQKSRKCLSVDFCFCIGEKTHVNIKKMKRLFTDRQTGTQTEGQTDGHTGRETDRETDGQTHRCIHQQTDLQTD